MDYFTKTKILFILLLSLTVMNIAQEKPDSLSKVLNRPEKIFQNFERGLNSGEIEIFFNSLTSSTYLSLQNGVSGYFSVNQLFYILKDFLTVYKPLSFKLNSIISKTNNPFATGTLRYVSTGTRGSYQVFISLSQKDEEWTISQITIN